MKGKVILISIDGMRPDGLKQCGNGYVKQLESECTYTYVGSSVMPTVTLPCHFSMTHSVTPQRHGILSNTYVPQIRPIVGLFEKISLSGGKNAMFYGWEHLRDIALPGSMSFSTFIHSYSKESTDTALTDEALRIIAENKPDFAFLYMVETDEKGGHDNGFMSAEYLMRISIAIDNVKRVVDAFGDEYSIIVMADHGGHDRIHGSNIPEDMLIPFFFRGERFKKNCAIEGVTLLDIAPTVVSLLGVEPEKEWEGRSLV